MLSIADYVKSRGVSQTAVRRQLKRYAEDLEGHIVATTRRKMLDDFAVEFLDSHRMPKEIIIEQADEQARKEVEELKAELAAAHKELLSIQEKYINIQRQHIELQEKQIPLIEDRSRLQQENQSLKDRAETAEAEVNSFEKSIFGFYRKKK